MRKGYRVGRPSFNDRIECQKRNWTELDPLEQIKIAGGRLVMQDGEPIGEDALG